MCGSGINLTLCVENGCKRKKKGYRDNVFVEIFFECGDKLSRINQSFNKKDKLGEGYGIVLNSSDN